MERTLSNGSGEKINYEYAVSEVPALIAGKCTSQCGNDLSVKYLVPKPLCEYFDMNII